MVNINFVPDDYVQNNESRRTNLLYLVLFIVVMAALGGSFATIKIRQRRLNAEQQHVNAKLGRAQEAIEQFEHLQAKRKEMMKTALTTAELIEQVPRSILLASLTNNLPAGVSLLQLNLAQIEPKKTTRSGPKTTYQKAQAVKADAPEVSREKRLKTHIDIKGVAPSNLQVAAYIRSLTSSSLLDNVALVESKEHKIDDTSFTQFKLTAMLAKDVHLTKEDIERIRATGEKSVWSF
jgi:Tfp pilus assembly protein PilN